MKNRPFPERLGYALAGIATVWRSERSFRTQVVFALLANGTTWALRPGWVWVALVLLATALVLALEVLNSALEYLMDQVHPSLAPGIQHAKDAAAGAVLIASCGAVVVGVCMLISL
ncbi:MAG TPA: diacylglycerol kinase [Planctomycetota bacterium]|nr:diacylglycerol kinase [Planctomycetota bacterium]